MTDEHPSVSHISRSRLEFLFDGVFAIAMTILVLELKVPEQFGDPHSPSDLARALRHQTPVFIGYLISFAMLGILWYRHNQQYRYFRVITRGMLVFHFVQLAAAAFFPFCAALYGSYPGNGLSLVFYLGCILVYLWASIANLLLAKRSGSLSAEMTDAIYARSLKRFVRGSIALSSMLTLYLVRVFFF